MNAQVTRLADLAYPTVSTVWTAHYRFDGPQRLDVSRQGRDPLGVQLAPSLELLVPYKRATKAGGFAPARWARYVADYTAEMRASFVAHDRWRALLERAADGVVLVCFCPAVARCHRGVAAKLLVAAGRGTLALGGEVRAKRCRACDGRGDGCAECEGDGIVAE